MKKIIIWLILGTLTVAMTFMGMACKAAATETTAAATETTAVAGQKFVKKEPVKIGYSAYDMLSYYWQDYAKGVEAACKEAGYEFVLHDQKSSQEAQVSGPLDLINQNISALIISPVQPEALPAVIDAAHAAKIPVIIGDVGFAGDYDVFVVSNNTEGGAMAAKYMFEQIGSKSGTKEILVIELHPGSTAGVLRSGGFVEEIKKYEDFKIVASLNGNDTIEGGYATATDALASNPNLAAIYACNDNEALGAVQALKAAGKKAGDIFIVGFDGAVAALEAIKNGDMSGTILQDPVGQGKACVEAATTLMNGEKVSFSNEAEKTIYFPVTVINKSNVDQYIK